MAVLTLRNWFDNIAAPSGARRRELRPSAGSAPSPPRFLSSRGVISPGATRAPVTLPRGPRFSSAGWPRRTPTAVRRQPAVPSMRQGLAALGRTVAAVQAAHSIGEGAGHQPARGNP